jgi:hypothetical protein
LCGGAGTKACASCLNPPYYGAQEKHPELQALISAMSAGPIAPGDVIGSSNATLIRSTCTQSGVLLKPDRPAFPPGAFFLRRLRGKGEVQLTHTTIQGAGRWTFCLSFGMTEQVNLTAEELGLLTPSHINSQLNPRGRAAHTGAPGDDTEGSFGVAWMRRNLQPLGVSASGQELQRYRLGEGAPPPLRLPMQPPVGRRGDWGLYTYWRTAPTSCRGMGCEPGVSILESVDID